MCRWYYTTVSITTLNKREIFNLDDWDGVVFQDADDNPIQYFHFLLIFWGVAKIIPLLFSQGMYEVADWKLWLMYMLSLLEAVTTPCWCYCSEYFAVSSPLLCYFLKSFQTVRVLFKSHSAVSAADSLVSGVSAFFFLRLNTAHIFVLPHSILRV